MLGLPSNSCLAHHVCVGEFWIAQLKNFEDTLSWLGNKASVCCSRGGSTLGSRSQSSSAGGGNGAMEGHVDIVHHFRTMEAFVGTIAVLIRPPVRSASGISQLLLIEVCR